MPAGTSNGLAVPEPRLSQLTKIVERVRAGRRVVLTTHVNADADGAGSEAAVAAWLESIGVGVTIINPTPFPESLRFLLHRDGLVVDVDDPAAPALINEACCLLVLDTSEENRVGALNALLDPAKTFVVDHHPPGPAVVGQGGVQDPSAAATGELVYDMISIAGDDWPTASAIAAYVAIVSDTGSFRYSNTTWRTHAIASELLALGVNPEEVFQRLFAVVPPRRILLLREALARLEHDPELGLAWMVVPKQVSDSIGSTSDDYEGLIEHARSIEGTRVAVLFRETAPGETKISLRSTGPVNVNRVARQFGGGGHVKASGASVKLALDDAVKQVLDAVRKEIELTRRS